MIFGSRKKGNGSAEQPPEQPPAPSKRPTAERTPPAPAAASRLTDRMEGMAQAQTPAPATASATATQAGNGGQQLDPEMVAKIAEIRTRLHETFGKVVLAAMTVPRYRNLSVSDLSALFLDPLMRDRIAIASAGKDGSPVEGTLSGIAIWASVSEEVDARIREQIRSGTFPVRLKPADWNSGKINWLLDVIAPTQRLTTAVIANFRQVVKEGDMRIHPIVTRLVDPEALAKMGAKPIKASTGLGA